MISENANVFKSLFAVEKKNKIEEEAFRRYPDCPERNFGTGEYEWPECHAEDRELFIEGAEWMQKTMIGKACEWLVNIDFEVDYQYNEDGYTFFDADKFIKEFRKAMEE
jgi:hypothetical protein